MAFYGPLCTAFYDLDKPEAPADAVAWYLQRARSAGGRVLEPMCGSGRLLLPLAQAGIAIDGFDVSDAMLDACRRQAAARGLDVGLSLQSVESFSLPHRYALAFVPSGSFGFVAGDDALRRALVRLRDHLTPGGTLLVEVVPDDDAPAYTEAMAPREVTCPDGSTIRYGGRVTRGRDPAALRIEGVYEQRRGDTTIATEHETLLLRLHRPTELVGTLLACGFASAQVHGAPHAPAFVTDGGCVLVEARTAA